MSRPKLFTITLAGLMLLGPLVGCVQRKDRSGLLKNLSTQQTVLRSQHTKAPAMRIKLPKGFQSEWVPEAKYDKFYIYAPNDTGLVQHGMLIIDVTPHPRWIIPDTAEYKQSLGSINSADAEWREFTLKPPGGDKVHQREMIQRELLKKYNSLDGEGALSLHVFVVGSDSLLVEQLTAVAETVTIGQAEPNL